MLSSNVMCWRGNAIVSAILALTVAITCCCGCRLDSEKGTIPTEEHASTEVYTATRVWDLMGDPHETASSGELSIWYYLFFIPIDSPEAIIPLKSVMEEGQECDGVEVFEIKGVVVVRRYEEYFKARTTQASFRATIRNE